MHTIVYYSAKGQHMVEENQLVCNMPTIVDTLPLYGRSILQYTAVLSVHNVEICYGYYIKYCGHSIDI